MSAENHYLNRIAIATEQLSRDMKTMIDLFTKISQQLEDIVIKPQPVEFNDDDEQYEKYINEYFADYAAGGHAFMSVTLDSDPSVIKNAEIDNIFINPAGVKKIVQYHEIPNEEYTQALLNKDKET